MKKAGLKEDICKYLEEKGLELVSQPGYRKQIYVSEKLTVIVNEKEKKR